MDSTGGGGYLTLPSRVSAWQSGVATIFTPFFPFYMCIYFILFIFRWKVAGVIIGTVSTDIGLNLWTPYILKFADYNFEDFLHPFTSIGLEKNTTTELF